MNAAHDWRWPLTWHVKPGAQAPFENWIVWHYHCLIPRITA